MTHQYYSQNINSGKPEVNRNQFVNPISFAIADMIPDSQIYAEEYIEKGWASVAISKDRLTRVRIPKPSFDSPSPNLRDYFPFGEERNVGIELGEASEGLVLVRLVTPEARNFSSMLPDTDLHHSNHADDSEYFWFTCNTTTPLIQTQRWNDIDGSPICEILSSGETVIVPPSTDQVGNRVRFDCDCSFIDFDHDPLDHSLAVIDGAELVSRVSLIATSLLLAKHWPTDIFESRKAAYFLAVGLIRSGVSEDRVVSLFLAIRGGTNNFDIDIKKIVGGAASMKVARSDAEIWLRLRNEIGEGVVRRVIDWIGISSHVAYEPAAAARVVTTEFTSRLSQSNNPAEVVRNALDDEDTLNNLAVLLERDKGGFEGVMMDIQRSGARVKDAERLRQVVNTRVRQRKHEVVVLEDETPETLVREVLPDAPTKGELVVPEGWRLSRHGVFNNTNPISSDPSDRVRVASSPILIEGRFKNIDNSSEFITLMWLRDGTWQRHLVNRGVITNERTILDLADFGFPVYSDTARTLVRYIVAFEDRNIDVLPLSRVSSHLGWQGKLGEDGFLWGKNLIMTDGLIVVQSDADESTDEDLLKDLVVFRGEDAGDEQIANGFKANGTFEAWAEALLRASKYPRVMLGLYASLATPLLKIMGASNFIIDWSNPTSTGKTSTLRVAGSVWGNPDETSSNTVLGTWNSTRVWIERALAMVNGTPLMLDDTKNLSDKRRVAQTVYEVSTGQGRGRGSVKGVSRSGNWNTILLSTGEAPLVSFTEDGGTRARVLTVWGSPFSATNEKTANDVNFINEAVRENYGHAGPLFVQFILRNRQQWTAWKDIFKGWEVYYRSLAGDNSVASRYSSYLAIIRLTVELVHIAGISTWGKTDPTMQLYAELTKESDDADVAARALVLLKSWASSHQTEFWGRHIVDTNGVVRPPAQGWAGAWQEGDDWEFIGFLPDRLNKILKEMEFDANAVRRTWNDRERLLRDGENKPRKQVRIFSEQSRVVAIKREAFDFAEI